MATLKTITNIMKEYPGITTDSGAFLFDNSFIEVYDVNKAYHVDDIVLGYNTTLKKYLMYKAVKDTSGVWVPTAWDKFNIATMMSDYNSSMVEDLSTIVQYITPLVNSEMKLNSMLVRPLDLKSELKITHGGYDEGFIFL